jgi:hypothetical protein
LIGDGFEVKADISNEPGFALAAFAANLTHFVNRAIALTARWDP